MFGRDALKLEVDADAAVDVMEFPSRSSRASSGGVLRGPSTTVDAYVDGGRVAARPAGVGPHTLELADGATANASSARRAAAAALGGAAGFHSSGDGRGILEPRAPPSPSSARTRRRCRCRRVPSASRASRRRPAARRCSALVRRRPPRSPSAPGRSSTRARPTVEVVDAPAGRRGTRRRWAPTAWSAPRDARRRGARRRRCTPAARRRRVVDVDDVDAEGAVVTKTGARCVRAAALLRSNVDAHGRVDHQTDAAYDGKVLEVHFSRRHPDNRNHRHRRGRDRGRRARRTRTARERRGLRAARGAGPVARAGDAQGPRSRTTRRARCVAVAARRVRGIHDAAGAGVRRGNGARRARAPGGVDAEVPKRASLPRVGGGKRRIDGAFAKGVPVRAFERTRYSNTASAGAWRRARRELSMRRPRRRGRWASETRRRTCNRAAAAGSSNGRFGGHDLRGGQAASAPRRGRRVVMQQVGSKPRLRCHPSR